MGAIRDEFFPTPNFEYMIVGTYILLCLMYMTIGINFTTGCLKMLLKCAPILFLITFFLYTTTSLHIGPLHPVGNVDNLERIVFGLMFSCLGDAYLVYDSFIHGIISFACAHLIYIGYFGGEVHLFIPPSYDELVIAAAVGLVSLLIYLYILPKLDYVLVIPAAVYCLVISLMLWCAIVTMRQNTELSTMQGAIGACLFYMSDLLLAVNRWNRWNHQIPFGPYLVISSYYLAQLLIFLSTLNTF